MKKLLLVPVALLALSGTALGVADKLTICHATGSATNPFVEITIAKQAVVNAHIAHQHKEDVIPAFGDFAGQGDLRLLANGCVVPADVHTPIDGGPEGTNTADIPPVLDNPDAKQTGNESTTPVTVEDLPKELPKTM